MFSFISIALADFDMDCKLKDCSEQLYWNTGALAFDVEYARWLDEHNRRINELRAAVNSHAGDAELRTIVDNVIAQYDEIFKLKTNAAKADVFHILSGMWKTPAERCFLWIGGFRSSELLKVCNLLRSIFRTYGVRVCSFHDTVKYFIVPFQRNVEFSNMRNLSEDEKHDMS